jgi:hypothetical protein
MEQLKDVRAESKQTAKERKTAATVGEIGEDRRLFCRRMGI